MGFEPSEQEMEWQLEHRDETQIPGLIAACVSTAIASVIIIGLRLLSRRLLHGRLRLETDDWLIFVSWVFFAVLDISWVVGTKYGIGRHAVVVTDVRMVQILAVVGEAAYVLSIAFLKFSVLALYLRTFPIPKFRYLVWAVGIVVVGWAMSGTVIAIFQCTSIEYVWRTDVEGVCLDFGLRNLVTGIMNVMTTILVVALVVPFAWNLFIDKERKWLVLATFAIGTSAWAMSIIRLPYSIKVGTSDGTWDATPAFIISVVEIVMSMLAISIPTYRPLYEHIFGGGVCRESNNSRACRYKETLHMGLYGKDAQNDVNVTSPGTHMGCDHGGINVTNHIELVRHAKKSGSWVRVTDDEEEELCKTAEEEELSKTTEEVQAGGTKSPTPPTDA
ncbi:hypothetical protein EV127DRAFT_505609 [Xylaria flabelliformis]|nr:hypothetical protein EV127DRAFT_505609 [Xylaria flabelliformis]